MMDLLFGGIAVEMRGAFVTAQDNRIGAPMKGIFTVRRAGGCRFRRCQKIPKINLDSERTFDTV